MGITSSLDYWERIGTNWQRRKGFLEGNAKDFSMRSLFPMVSNAPVV